MRVLKKGKLNKELFEERTGTCEECGCKVKWKAGEEEPDAHGFPIGTSATTYLSYIKCPHKERGIICGHSIYSSDFWTQYEKDNAAQFEREKEYEEERRKLFEESIGKTQELKYHQLPWYKKCWRFFADAFLLE